MKLLLDTHTLLWFIGGSPNLSKSARSLIEDTAHRKFVSIVSIWETAIKVSIGKMTLTAPFDDLFPHQLQINGFDLLPVKAAQAISESMTVVSIDEIFDDYKVPRLW